VCNFAVANLLWNGVISVVNVSEKTKRVQTVDYFSGVLFLLCGFVRMAKRIQIEKIDAHKEWPRESRRLDGERARKAISQQNVRKKTF